MKRTLGLLLAGACLTSLLGGCEPKAKYDELVAVNRRANERLAMANQQTEMLESEKNRLAQDLVECNRNLDQQKRANDVLEQNNAELLSKLNQVNELYKKLINEGQPPAMGPIRLLPEPLHKALQAFAAQSPDLVEYIPSRGMVKFKSDLTFNPGSDRVQPDAKEALSRFVEIVNDPAARSFHVYIAGHTDDIPIKKPETRRVHPNNWYLSVHRAVAVQEVLAEAGLNEERMAAMGFSKYHPIAPNKPGNKGNEKNRRVEVFIVSPDRLLTTPMDHEMTSDNVPEM